ncbi:MAG: SPFH domain-containing protein [Anaerolineae bacterium]|nr:SPFH domain-containing protein [Anaerolineae bacterium]
MFSKLLSTIIIFSITFIGLIIFLIFIHPYWVLGTALIVFAWIIYLLFFIPYKSTTTRARWTFWACFTIITATVTTYLVLLLLANPITINIPAEAFSFLEFIEVKPTTYEVNPKVTSLIVASIIGFITTFALFVLVGYLSSFYILALHEEEMSFWDALKSFFSLLFNKQLGWLLVEEGKVKDIKGKGVKGKGFPYKWLNQGKITIKAGNAIVTEKGAKITGIHGPGVVITSSGESIREVFDLRPQNVTHELKDVITHDKIPLKIVLGVGYRITPAANPNLPNVLKEKNLGVYPVEKQTLQRAAFNSGAGGWKGFGENVAVGHLRDQIMAHRFDDIFVISDYDDDISIRVDERQIKKIENSIKNAINSFDDKNLGVIITSVDIKEIHFPEKIREKLTTELTTLVEERIKQTQAKYIVTEARARAQARILSGQGEAEARAAFFREVLQELKKEDAFDDIELVNSVLKQMSSTMVDIEELRTFVRSTGYMERSVGHAVYKRHLGEGQMETNGNGHTNGSDIEFVPN